MATYQDTAGKTFSTRQEAAASNTALGTNPTTPPVAPVTPAVTPTTTTPVITPDSLKPATAPVVTPAPVPTEAPKLQADLQAGQDALVQKNAADLAAAKTNTTDSRQKLNDLFANFQGVNQLSAAANAAPGGVDAITPELNKVNDQIRQEQRALDLAKRNITERGGGLASGAAAEISNLERVSLQKQADLSIIQQAVQGRYDSAKTIADRAVAAKFEEQTQKLDAAKFDYTENKALFTTAEQRQYDQMFADRQTKIADAKKEKSDIYDLALQAQKDGAPTDVVQRMMASNTKDGALATGGSYIGALDRQAKQAQIRASNASVINSNTDRLLKLATAGDKTAITKLGFDPNAIIDQPSIEVAKINSDPVATAIDKNSAVITALLSPKSKVSEGARTTMATTLGVINSLHDIADANPTGSFAGVNPGRALLDIKIPFTNTNIIPFRDALKQEATVKNEGYINAINLKVQQWASGASLTEDQTKKVNELVPNVYDTDAKFQTKMNNLADFMLTQVSSSLQSQGIDFKPQKVDFFETQKMIDKLSPEQQAQLKSQGLI